MNIVTAREQWWREQNKRCEFCPVGLQRVFHGKCTDPYGRKGECRCYVSSDSHREMWSLPVEDGGPDPSDDSVPYGSRMVERWADEKRQHEEETR